MKIIEVKGIKKVFSIKGEKFTAVNNVSFSIEAGECLGIVGESGCGKSTTANIIARLLKEDAGTIFFNGKEISKGKYLKPVGRNLQMVFQNPQDSFDPRDTVINGIMQGIQSYDRASREKALEIFDYIGLKASYADVKTSELSGGECQRAAIGRAIISEPKLIICDEVTSALDVLVQAQIVALLKRLKAEKKMTMLFITHDIPLASVLCDRIAVMHKGEIKEIGDTRTILKHPKHEQTKKLINSVLTI